MHQHRATYGKRGVKDEPYLTKEEHAQRQERNKHKRPPTGVPKGGDWSRRRKKGRRR